MHITTEPPYAGRQGRWWQTPARLANAIHTTTRQSVVRRFLLLSEGDRCTERKRAESERILRAQPFIAQAHVTTEPDEHGGIMLIIDTRDERNAVFAADDWKPFLLECWMFAKGELQRRLRRLGSIQLFNRRALP